MENKQTAVEWLVEDLTRLGHNFKLYKKEIEQAKAMEKEQIEESFKHGRLPVLFGSFGAEDYYNEKYGNKK